MKHLFFLIVGLLAFCETLPAQFYKVYDYQPTEAWEIEFALWNSYIASSDLEYNFFGEKLSRQDFFAHSLGLEYGLSNKWGIAFYLDYEDPKEGSLKHVRTNALMAHYAFFDKGSRPVDIAIYLEYIFNNNEYKNYEEFEMRIILGRTDLSAGEKVILRAGLNYRRMPDSYAEYLSIPTRPILGVSRDERILTIAP